MIASPFVLKDSQLIWRLGLVARAVIHPAISAILHPAINAILHRRQRQELRLR